MKSPNIESLYANLDKSIKLIESYSEINNLAFIIKACRLKPYEYMKERSGNIVLYRKWYDEFGNSFNLIKNKKIKIIIGDLSVRSICTDMYYGLSIFKMAKMSKMISLSFGKDEDYQDDCCSITLLGIDNYLRSYLYIYDEWQQVSTLTTGMVNIKNIVKNLDIKYYHKLQNKENSNLPCIAGQTWLSFMPASEEFIDLVRRECSYILPLFTKDY